MAPGADAGEVCVGVVVAWDDVVDLFAGPCLADIADGVTLEDSLSGLCPVAWQSAVSVGTLPAFAHSVVRVRGGANVWCVFVG